MVTVELQKKFMDSRKTPSSESSGPAICFAPGPLNQMPTPCENFFQSIFENAAYGIFQSTPDGMCPEADVFLTGDRLHPG